MADPLNASTAEVLDFIKQDDPRWKDVPDDEIVTFFVENEPGFNTIPSFKQRYQEIKNPREQLPLALELPVRMELGRAAGILDVAREVPVLLQSAIRWGRYTAPTVGFIPGIIMGSERAKKLEDLGVAGIEKGMLEPLRAAGQKIDEVSGRISTRPSTEFAQNLTRTAAASAPSIAAAPVLGFKGAVAVGALQSFASTTEETYLKLKEQGVDEDTARNKAELTGVAAGIGTAAFTAMFGGIEKLFARVGAGELSKATFRKLAGMWFKGTISEGLEEGLDNGWQKIVELYTTDRAKLFSEEGKKEIWEAMRQGFVYGGALAAITGGAVTLPEMVGGRKQRTQAAEAAKAFPTMPPIPGTALAEAQQAAQASIEETPVIQILPPPEANLPAATAAINEQEGVLRGRTSRDEVLGVLGQKTPPTPTGAPNLGLTAEEQAAAQAEIDAINSRPLSPEDEALIRQASERNQQRQAEAAAQQAPAQPVETAVQPSAPAAERGGVAPAEPAPAPSEQVQAEQPVAQPTQVQTQPETTSQPAQPTNVEGDVARLNKMRAGFVKRLSNLPMVGAESEGAALIQGIRDVDKQLETLKQPVAQPRPKPRPTVVAEQQSLRRMNELTKQRTALVNELDALYEQGAEENPREQEISDQLDAIGEEMKRLQGRETPPAEEPGVTGPGAVPAAIRRLRKAWNELRPEYSSDPKSEPTLEDNPIPAPAPQTELKEQVTIPRGLGRLWLIGRVLDGRYKGANPIRNSFIVYRWIRKLGRDIAVLTGADVSQYEKAFVFNEDGQVVNVPGEAYLADLAEKWYADPKSVNLNDQQQAALRKAQEIFGRMLDLMASEGVPRAQALKALFGDTEVTDAKRAYFARGWLQKGEEEAPRRGGGGVTETPRALKARSFPSEEAGAKAGHKYNPSFVGRITAYVENGYAAIAAHRLLNDPSVQGESVEQRLEETAEAVFPELKALKNKVWEADTEAKQKALYERYREVFDDLAEENPDQFAAMREEAGKVRAGEGKVSKPGFMEYIYDDKIAAKINEELTPPRHRVIEALLSVSKLFNAFQLSLDNSAPLVQGLPALFWSLRTGNNVWGRAVAANAMEWFKPGYLKRIMANPKYRQAALEWVQLGRSLGRLNDFMAGAGKGELATQLPGIGKAFERSGGAYGAFIDMAKLEWWMAVRDSAPKTEWRQLSEGIDNLMGQADLPVTGLNPSLVQTAGILARAPSYYAAGANTLLNLFAKGATGKVTQQAMGSMFAGTLFLSIAGMLAAGLSLSEIQRKLERLDLTVPVPLPNGRRVNVGMSHIAWSIVKAAVQTGLYVADDKPINEVLGGGAERNPVLRFAWGHAGPLPNSAIETLLEQDFVGQQTSWYETAIKQVTPLMLGQVKETLMRESAISAIGDALPTGLGLNAYPEPYRAAWYREANAAGIKEFGKGYDQLSVFQQQEVIKKIKGENEFLKQKPPVTRRQAWAMVLADARRKRNLLEGLTPENRQLLANNQINVTGYSPTMTIRGETVYLSKPQEETYQQMIVEEYNKIIDSHKSNLRSLPVDRKQVVFNGYFTAARERARARFIASEREKEKLVPE